MALATVSIDPGGFDPLNGAPGGVNADEATPEQIASAFEERFGPFDYVEEIESDEGRAFVAVGPDGRRFRIYADVVHYPGMAVDNVLEIFSETIVDSLLSGSNKRIQC